MARKTFEGEGSKNSKTCKVAQINWLSYATLFAQTAHHFNLGMGLFSVSGLQNIASELSANPVATFIVSTSTVLRVLRLGGLPDALRLPLGRPAARGGPKDHSSY